MIIDSVEWRVADLLPGDVDRFEPGAAEPVVATRPVRTAPPAAVLPPFRRFDPLRRFEC